MAMKTPLYNLTLPEAIARLQEEVEKNATQKNTPELQGMTPDESYDVGYRTCLHDLISITGPNPTEVGLISFEGGDAE